MQQDDIWVHKIILSYSQVYVELDNVTILIREFEL